MRYRLYIDESGDHSSSDTERADKRYLGLAGLMFEQTKDYKMFQAGFQGLKEAHFPHDPDYPLVLHRTDILHKRGIFKCLQDEQRCAAFDRALLELIVRSTFRIVAVVIDKTEHGSKTYRSLTHPYHYAIHAMLERYCGWLARFGQQGDVMAEARGGEEDRELKRAYREVYFAGTGYMKKAVAQKALTSRELKLKPKEANVAGLQLADLLAHPLTRDVLIDYGRIEDRRSLFAVELARAIEPKYNRQVYENRIRGYGRILLR